MEQLVMEQLVEDLKIDSTCILNVDSSSIVVDGNSDCKRYSAAIIANEMKQLGYEIEAKGILNTFIVNKGNTKLEIYNEDNIVLISIID